jgi:hypothetical protein
MAMANASAQYQCNGVMAPMAKANNGGLKANRLAAMWRNGSAMLKISIMASIIMAYQCQSVSGWRNVWRNRNNK